jgi:hypothetical protein
MNVRLATEHRFDLNRHERTVLAVFEEFCDRSRIDRHIPGERQITRAEWDEAARSLRARGMSVTEDS